MQRLGYNGVADAQDSRDFNYLMIYHPSENKPFLEEFRTDKKGRPISQEEMKGFIATSGYACLSLNFHPSYLNASRFRYLGKQISDARAHIIAFAQEPNRDGLLISYAASRSDKPARFAVQGIAWIDPGSYQILRLLINILPEGNHTPLTEQTTDIQFSEMSFSDSQKPMWLPREVVVTTKLSGVRFRTLHRYSDHHLFAVTSDYKIDRPKSKD